MGADVVSAAWSLFIERSSTLWERMTSQLPGQCLLGGFDCEGADDVTAAWSGFIGRSLNVWERMTSQLRSQCLLGGV